MARIQYPANSTSRISSKWYRAEELSKAGVSVDQTAQPLSLPFSEEDGTQSSAEYIMKIFQVTLFPASNGTMFFMRNNALVLY